INVKISSAGYGRSGVYEELLDRVCVQMRDAMSQGTLGLQCYGDIVGVHPGEHKRCAVNPSQSKEWHVCCDIVETAVDPR
ncbi:hypothetical protein COCMIDRAFT_97068, partial [Bipolaris oryzae ATCC 44560]